MSPLGVRQRASPRAPPTAAGAGAIVPSEESHQLVECAISTAQTFPGHNTLFRDLKWPGLVPGRSPHHLSRPLVSAGGEGRERQDPSTQGPALWPIVRPLKTKHPLFSREAPGLLHKSGRPHHSDAAQELQGGSRGPTRIAFGGQAGWGRL